MKPNEVRGESVDGQYNNAFSRNLGFFTELEQEKIKKSSTAIAGVGGVGGLLAERLIRLGMGQLKILDPQDFEPSNFNRQFCASMHTLGRNKAEAVFKQIDGINPCGRVFYSKSGIKTQDDADLFISDCDVIVDAMDFGLFKESVYLQRAARRKDIYYVFASALGFGALVVIFNPQGMTLEEYDKFPSDIDLENAGRLVVPPERVCPVVPSYAIPASRDAEKILDEIVKGVRPAPTTSIGVGLASIIAANEVMNIILRKRDIACAPYYTYVDLIDRKYIVDSVF